MLKKIIITAISVISLVAVPFILAFSGVLNGLSYPLQLLVTWTAYGLLILLGIIYLGTEN